MILVIGSIHKDKKFSGVEKTVPVEQGYIGIGGKGANQAIAAAKYGADVVLLGCASNDRNGQQMTLLLNEAGVNTDYVRRVELVELEEVSSINMLATPEYISRYEALFRKADACVLQMELPTETVKKAIALSNLYNVPVILNASPMNSLDYAVLRGTEYVILNREEAAELIGEKSAEYVSGDSWIHFMRCHAFRNLIIMGGEEETRHYGIKGTSAIYPAMRTGATEAENVFLGAFAASLSRRTGAVGAITFANTVSAK